MCGKWAKVEEEAQNYGTASVTENKGKSSVASSQPVSVSYIIQNWMQITCKRSIPMGNQLECTQYVWPILKALRLVVYVIAAAGCIDRR